MGQIFLPLELGWHEQTVKHIVTSFGELLLQFDWLIYIDPSMIDRSNLQGSNLIGSWLDRADGWIALIA